MFDIAWSEMVVIGAVALIAIGPKDLPKALRAVGAMTAKARRMASEFQDHFREAMREAELESVKQEVANIHQDLSSATSGLQSEFNSIGSQLPNSSEPVVQPAPGVEAAPLPSDDLAGAAAGKAEASSSEMGATGAGATKPASTNTEPAATVSAEATPAAVIVTETAASSSPAEKPVSDNAIGEKPVRKRRAASRSKAKSDTPAQASLAIEPAHSVEARPKPRKRAAKALPPGDDRAA